MVLVAAEPAFFTVVDLHLIRYKEMG